MKFISFKTQSGTPSYGLHQGDHVIDLGSTRPQLPSLKDFLASREFQDGSPMDGPVVAATGIMLLPVIPNPGKIVCVGLNYQEHVQETGRSDSEYPALFLRTTASQLAHRAPLVRPAISERFDFEGELAVIIGRGGRNIVEEDALSHIAGYACYNDVSVRDWQRHTHQWTPGKNFNGTGAFGPWLTTEDILKDRANTWLTTRVNGETMQTANLGQMIFSIEELIAYISGFSPLEVGDVIVTGTPGGVGDRRKPPVYLRAGDNVEIEIDGIGILENQVVDEA